MDPEERKEASLRLGALYAQWLEREVFPSAVAALGQEGVTAFRAGQFVLKRGKEGLEARLALPRGGAQMQPRAAVVAISPGQLRLAVQPKDAPVSSPPEPVQTKSPNGRGPNEMPDDGISRVSGKVKGACPSCARMAAPVPGCPRCGGTGYTHTLRG